MITFKSSFPFLLLLTALNAELMPHSEFDCQCQHGGECRHHEESKQFYCECPVAYDESKILAQGYQGFFCETAFSTCSDRNGTYWRCYNNALCHTDVSCLCNNDKYSGRFCNVVREVKSDSTSKTCDLPCAHGVCKYNGFGEEYFCDCPHFKDNSGFFTSGFQGIACETKFVNCQDENRRNWRCYNDAVCGYDVGCVCNSDDFTGKFCEIPSNGFSYDNILPKSEESRKGNMLLRIIFGILLSISPCFVLVSALVQRRKNASQGNFSKLEDVKVADCEVTKGEII